MAGAVTTTISVEFTEGDDDATAQGNLYAEKDSRENGLNGGRTSFRPGEDVYFLVYTDRVTVTSIASSAGTVTSAGSGSRTVGVDDYASAAFINSRSATLSIPASSWISRDWLGNDLGAVNAPNASTLEIETEGLGVLQLQYNANFSIHKLSGVDVTIPEVQILITGQKTG